MLKFTSSVVNTANRKLDGNFSFFFGWEGGGAIASLPSRGCVDLGE